MSEKVVVSIPNRSASSQMNASLAYVLQNLEMPEGRDVDVSVNFSYLQPVDANRNQMVKDFLNDEDADWLLMIDNDVVPPKDILGMIEYGEDVVSAAVTIKKQGVPNPVVMKRNEETGEYRSITMEEYVDEIQDNGLVEVDGVGTGCLLIHRSVLEGMTPPWFKFIYNEDGTLKLGEDFYFGEMCRKNDVPMYVSDEYVCSHFRKTDLTEFAQIVAEAENLQVDE